MLKQADDAGLVSHEHFSVDGTLIEAWASIKSYKPKAEQSASSDGPPDPPPPEDDGTRNASVDFRGEKRTNETHASTTDPDAKLKEKVGKKFKATTNSRHSLPVAPNLLNQDFTCSAPDQKWCGDITYLWTDEGWLYLAVVLDLYSRRVIGWSMSERMNKQLACDAMQMAIDARQPTNDTIMHTDRGSQYCSNQFLRLLKGHGIQSSMSKKGDCYDNAAAESFFHTLKVEAIHGEQFPTRESMRSAVFDYIEVDYNRNRRHTSIGNQSPVNFELAIAA